MAVAHARPEDPGELLVISDAALASLGVATAELLARTEPSELLELIVQNVAFLAGTPHAYICLIEPDGRFTGRPRARRSYHSAYLRQHDPRKLS